MLDIKFIEENRELVAAAIKNRNRTLDLDELLQSYGERKTLRQKLDELNRERNEAARVQDIETGKRLKSESEQLEPAGKAAEKKFLALMLQVPNLPSPDTPVGPDESANQVLRQVGEKPKFNFPAKDHQELGLALGLIDTETAGKIAGARFAYLKGDLVLLQFALIQFCFSLLTAGDDLAEIARAAGLSIPVTPFTPVLPPVFVKPAVQNRMARFLTPEEHYLFPNDDLMLIGSAEHTLGPLHMDETLAEKRLPIRYVGYSTAFRREAGAAGQDTKGILRQHQFDKLEMETLCLPEQSIQEQNFLVAIQEHILTALGLPYQVVAVATGDLGFPDYRQIDLETWLPGQNRYRETHSADLTGSFQARRLNTRVRRADGKIEPVHMNDATVLALGRTFVAIMENYQTAEGRVRVPTVVHTYLDKTVITRDDAQPEKN